MTALGVSLFVVFAATANAAPSVSVPSNYRSTVRGLIAGCTSSQHHMVGCRYTAAIIPMINRVKMPHKQAYLNYLYALRSACATLRTDGIKLFSAEVVPDSDYSDFLCTWGTSVTAWDHTVEITLPHSGSHMKIQKCSAFPAGTCFAVPGNSGAIQASVPWNGQLAQDVLEAPGGWVSMVRKSHSMQESLVKGTNDSQLFVKLIDALGLPRA